MTRTAFFAFVCIMSLTLAACSESAPSNTNVSSTAAAPTVFNSDKNVETTVQGRSSGNGAGGGGKQEARAEKISLEEVGNQQPAAQQRKIIRNANLTLETGSPEEASRKIQQIAESKNGFVITSETRTSDQSGGSAITTIKVSLRVPAEQFDQTISEIRQTATRTVTEKVEGQDVTEEFIDVQARLNAKKALEAQFLEIMKQARSVADALQVQTEIAEVRGEIERLEGRRKFLESQTSLSTITVSLQTPAVFAQGSTGFFSKLADAFGDGIDAALNVVLFLITAFLALLPFFVLLGVPLYLLVRYLKRRTRRQKLAAEFAAQENKL